MTPLAPKTAERSLWRWRIAAWLLLGTVGSLGCNPLTLGFLLGGEPTLDPDFALAKKGKEVKVAFFIFADKSLSQTPEVIDIDRSLRDVFIAQMRTRFEENKEKVKVVPSQKIQAYMSRHANWETHTPQRIGQDLDVDMVVKMEIQNIDLYEKLRDGRLNNQMLFGTSAISIRVFDAHAEEDSPHVYEKALSYEYPRGRGPQPADGGQSVSFFRTAFTNRVAGELVKTFSKYPSLASKSEFD